MSASDLDSAIDAIRRGGVVAAPTDTLVGLLALARDASAVDAVLAIKGADRRAALPVLVHDLSAAEAIAARFPDAARRLATEGWPGPLTLILPLRRGVLAPAVTAGGDTVGLRVPGPSTALDLLRVLGEPLTGTSANVTGQPPPVGSDGLSQEVVAAVDVVLPGRGSLGVASTVIDVTGEEPVVVRQGTFVVRTPGNRRH